MKPLNLLPCFVLLWLPLLALAQNCNDAIPASTPTGNFIPHADGTVTDINTGLTWQRCLLGQQWLGDTCGPFKPVASFLSWGAAMANADKNSFSGFDDWRLPSVEELRTIVEQRCDHPSINLQVFPNAHSGEHWTRESYESSDDYAWRISFEDGSENADLKLVTSYVVRLVRGDLKIRKKQEAFVPPKLDDMDSETLRLQRSILAETWDDGIHDLDNPGLNLLQKPAESMVDFQRNKWGRVDWIRVLQSGEISPKKGLDNEATMIELDMDILFKDTANMDWVKFPHKPHTQWLDCKNCHTRLFPYKAGLVDIKMDDILKGEYCGLCHGKVAFSPMLCDRCHSVPKEQ